MEYSKLTTQEKLDLARHLYLLNRVLASEEIKPIYI